LEKKVDKLLESIEERLKYLSSVGVEFVSASSKEPVYSSLNERILGCQKCPLWRGRTHAVPGEGNIKTELVFVGEAPGRDEDIQGRPFVGKAGQLLTKIIEAMHFKREDVYITNVVKCRPPENRTPQREEVEACRNYLQEQLEMIKPKVVVALGKVAADFFIESRASMTSLRGNFYQVGAIQVMPTFHPSYLVRNEGNKILKRMVWDDMKKVMARLGKE
jgi:DNA polymerase